jgi:hypothetical protein
VKPFTLATEESMPKKPLPDHVLGTYVTLRYGLAAIGAALPVLVWAIGLLHDVGLRGSISAYYWADPLTRDVFVGSLFAVGACLYLYKGFTTRENLALNAAAVFAVCVGLFPTGRPGTAEAEGLSVHGTSAILMFVCLAYVTWFRTGDTLTLLPESERGRYRLAYRVIALLMLAAPLSALVMDELIDVGRQYVFFAEACGIWTFAAYWWTKSMEFEHSNPTRKVIRNTVAARPDGALAPVRPDAAAVAEDTPVAPRAGARLEPTAYGHDTGPN